ncbi:MAG: hypothetical protein EOO85_30165 [Pedobacter sp.]|nr:MAG: hypothetical protein EOO85_30165 [Pedobacter sp.]
MATKDEISKTTLRRWHTAVKALLRETSGIEDKLNNETNALDTNDRTYKKKLDAYLMMTEINLPLGELAGVLETIRGTHL